MQFIVILKYSCSSDNILKQLEKYIQYTNNIHVEIINNTVCLRYKSGPIECDFINSIRSLIPEIQEVKISNFPITKPIDKIQSKILNVSRRKDITVFSKGLLHMQLPFYTDLFYPWIYCHFINIYYCPWGYMNYVDDVKYNEILEIQDAGYDRYFNLNNEESFVKAINEEKYIQIWVDNYYIPTSSYYEKYHDIHPVLIYGYTPKTYLCARFNKLKGLDFTEINIEQLHFSVESAKIYYYCPSEIPLKFLKVKELNGEYNNSVGYFLSELKQYRLGKGSRDFSYNIHKQALDHANEFFGIEITKCFIEGLKKPGLYSLFDYRLLHLIVENKQLILNAMKYHNSSHHFKCEIDFLISKYEKIVVRYQNMRLLYIKQSSIENGIDGFSEPPKDQKTITRITTVIEQLYEEEKELLDIYIPLMEKKMVVDRQYVNAQPVICTWDSLDMKTDNNGSYVEIKLDTETPVGDVEIYNPYGCFEGDLFYDNEVVSCHDMDAVYDFLKIHIGNKKISNIKYYPKRMLLQDGKPEIQITIYKPNLILNATVTASSIFSEIPSMSFSPQNVASPAANETNWAPEQNDKERWLRFDFQSPTTICAFSMTQYRLEQRVLEYKVEAQNYDGIWKTLIHFTGVMGNKTKYHEINPLEIISLKVTFMREKMDDNGYDIPRITNVSLY